SPRLLLLRRRPLFHALAAYPHLPSLPTRRSSDLSALALLFRKIMPSVIEQGYLYTVAGWDVYLPEIIISVTALVVFGILNIRGTDRKSTRLNSSHVSTSYAVFCLKKKRTHL